MAPGPAESSRSAFAGGDQAYIRDEQYRDDSRLARRANLHTKHSVAPIGWFDFVLPLLELTAGSKVLEVGCGAGWLWQRSQTPIPSGVDLTLTDLSPGMVETARAAVLESGRVASVSDETADLQSLPFESASFDRVVANHMLYHLPDPEAGVRELARVVVADGVVVAATNGIQHMKEIWQIRGAVFDIDAVDRTLDVFGAETGFPVLRRHFGDVRWVQYRDEIRCNDPEDVIAYLCSTPPAEDAGPNELVAIRAKIDQAFQAGDGIMRVTKDTGCFVCRDPRR